MVCEQDMETFTSRLESDGNKGVLRIPPNSSITGA